MQVGPISALSKLELINVLSPNCISVYPFPRALHADRAPPLAGLWDIGHMYGMVEDSQFVRRGVVVILCLSLGAP